jgi:hypothetical protein
MLAGVRLAHHCSYPSLYPRMTKDWSVQNNQLSEQIENIEYTPYRDVLEDTYALIADRMSSFEQYVPPCDTFHGIRVGSVV